MIDFLERYYAARGDREAQAQLMVDFGYTNPFTCQWWAMDHDGRLYLYREIFHQEIIEVLL